MAGNVAASSAGPHGTYTDSTRKRVKCNYCPHETSNIHRLKLHLACITGDVRSCPNVPETVKELMRNRNVAKSKDRCLNGSDASQERVKDISLDSNDNKHGEMMLNSASRVENAVELVTHHIQISGMVQPRYKDTLEQQNSRDQFILPPRIGIANVAAASTSYPVQSSMSMATGQPTMTVRGDEVRRYIREARASWDQTGCSILTDVWINKDGQKFLQFVVDSPMGPIYLQSHDISEHEEEAEAVLSLVDRLIGEIGAENVAQIVESSNLWDMWILRDIIEERNNPVFFSFSSSYCLELMLKRMEELPLFGGVEQIMKKSKVIVDFFFRSDDTIFEQLQDYCSVKDLLTRPVKFRQAKSYLMLQSLVNQKRKLKIITGSSEWKASSFAQSKEGYEVWQIIWRDPGFWAGAKDVLKLTLPMINVLYSMDRSPLPQMGFIYKMIDEMKSQLEEVFKGREVEYDDISKVIDEVWNKDLHSDLHCAGYFLNPCLGRIDVDYEVIDGLTNCITRMIPKIQDQQKVQLEALSLRREGIFSETSTESSPVDWWICREGQFSKELRWMAIRILSQTCDGVSRFQLQRTPTENMLARGRNPSERRILSDAAFNHYNLDLKRFKFCLQTGVKIEEIDRD